MNIKVFLIIVISVIVLIGVCYSWVNGIDHMKENHPDYDGNDFLNEEENDKN